MKYLRDGRCVPDELGFPGENESSHKWIAGAVQRPGAFTAKAKRAGKSVGEYAQEEKGAPGRLGRQARLAITLRKIGKKG